MGGTVSCLVTATTKTKYSMQYAITFSPFHNLGLSPDVHE